MRIEAGLLLLCALAGCRTAPVAPPSEGLPATPSLEWQETTLRQRQEIQALIAHNEALRAEIHELNARPVTPPTPTAAFEKPAAKAEPPVPRAAAQKTPEADFGPVLLPNADGLIDLTVLPPSRDGDEDNPFAVRILPADAVREIPVHVAGVVGGEKPCAFVNGRPVQEGESVDSLRVVRIAAEGVLFLQGSHLLRIPVSAKPVRVRVAL